MLSVAGKGQRTGGVHDRQDGDRGRRRNSSGAVMRRKTFWPQQIGVRGFRRQDTGFAMPNRLQTVIAPRLRRRRRQQEQQGHVGHILKSCAQATKFSTAVDRVLHLQLY